MVMRQAGNGDGCRKDGTHHHSDQTLNNRSIKHYRMRKSGLMLAPDQKTQQAGT